MIVKQSEESGFEIKGQCHIDVKVVLDGYPPRFRWLRICVIWVNTIVCIMLIDFKVALYICPNHTDIDIPSDHGYLDTLEQPSRTTLNAKKNMWQSTSDRVVQWIKSDYVKVKRRDECHGHGVREMK